jgi:hypothetical protein
MRARGEKMIKSSQHDISRRVTKYRHLMAAVDSHLPIRHTFGKHAQR